MIQLEVTPDEKSLILILRDQLRPFESIKITKDKDGKPNSYFVERVQKMMVSNVGITYIKL
jgi:hypothetical protein